MKRFFGLLKYFDWYLVINTILLMIFSLATLYSLQLNVNNPNYTVFHRQLIFVALGLVLFFLISSINYRTWGDFYKVIIIATLIIMAGVLFLGVTIRGTSGWVRFFGQTFQPVELAKIGLIIFLAKYFSIHGQNPKIFKKIGLAAIPVMALVLLVVRQPDLGSAMILFLTFLGLVFLLPLRKKHLLTILVIILVLGTVFWLFFLQDYQKDRLLTFVQPQRDPLGTGYNVTQAIVSVGSGRLFGRGLGLGSQSQLNFLPEQQTDFIFAVIAEELGFVGSGLLLLMFFSLFMRIFWIARATSDNFGQLFALGILIYLSLQTIVNIAMNMGMAPVTGIPLPLVSYGGSSLLSVLIGLGIVQSLYIKGRQSIFERSDS